MNSNTLANQFWRKHITFDKLPDKENAEPRRDRPVGRPELRDRHAKRQHKTGHGSDIGDKCDETGDEDYEETKIKHGQSERNRIKAAEDKAHPGLPTHKAGNRNIHFTSKFAHRVAILDRDPAVDAANHSVPVVDQVEGNHWRHDDKREYRDKRADAGRKRSTE